METFDFKALLALSNDEFTSNFQGKRIRVTTLGKVTEGVVNAFSLSYGSGEIIGFIFDNNHSVAFSQNTVVEVLSK